MWSQINGTWQWNDYTYTTTNTTSGKAVLISPTPGTQLSGSTVTFGWTAGSGVTVYSLWLGTTGPGSNDLYYPYPSSALSATVTGVAASGGKIYARMWSQINGAWQWNDYTYTAF